MGPSVRRRATVLRANAAGLRPHHGGNQSGLSARPFRQTEGQGRQCRGEAGTQAEDRRRRSSRRTWGRAMTAAVSVNSSPLLDRLTDLVGADALITAPSELIVYEC